MPTSPQPPAHAPRRLSRLTLFVAAAAFLLLGALLIWQGFAAHSRSPQPSTLKLSTATLINDDAPLPAFSLESVGGALTNANLAGHWTLLFFGYTYCPDICPTTLAVLRDMVDDIARRQLAAPQVWMVSVDPARDTPAKLAEYAHFFAPTFIGATAPDTQRSVLERNLGVFYQRHEKDGAHYTVDHSASVYLIDPQGRLNAVFAMPQDAAAMAQDYARLISAQTSGAK